MYCGNNKTALASQRQIADALIELLNSTPYSAISISAICKAAGVSRQTFYSLFESKDNIIIFELNRKHIFHPGTKCQSNSMSLKDIAEEFSLYIVERRAFLALLVQNDIIYLMHQSLYESFIRCPHFIPDCDVDYKLFAAEFVASGLSSIAKNYIMSDIDITAENLSEIIYSLFSGKIFH